MLNKIIGALIFIIFLMAAVFIYFSYSIQSDNKNSTNSPVSVAVAEPAENVITSGTSKEPIVITLENFYWDGTRYIGSFKVTNNTDYIIRQFVINVDYMYRYKGMEDGGGSTYAFCAGLVQPKKTDHLTAFFPKESKVEDVGSRKLTSMGTTDFIVNNNGVDQHMDLDELKKIVNSNVNNQGNKINKKKVTKEAAKSQPPQNNKIDNQSIKITQEEAIRLLNKRPKGNGIIKITYEIFSQDETTMKLPPNEKYFIFLPTFHESDGQPSNGDTLYCVDKYNGKMYTYSSTGELKMIK
ncbi:hypothetical protein [Clostridium estertheticum]|uniref:Uncharacterized protein n=1 Tax=Clostridium estertheticum TaxID=238834 RepID=A0A7Y3WQX2_9CLOT|nr:hypothetical protein [Clostridium estertheticum]NNU74340.1 hypothetical protein [Clostridium estertheticum]WBL45237.1 hypothetical protein LOR37_11005 [Clostridium estertheticum]